MKRERRGTANYGQYLTNLFAGGAGLVIVLAAFLLLLLAFFTYRVKYENKKLAEALGDTLRREYVSYVKALPSLAAREAVKTATSGSNIEAAHDLLESYVRQRTPASAYALLDRDCALRSAGGAGTEWIDGAQASMLESARLLEQGGPSVAFSLSGQSEAFLCHFATAIYDGKGGPLGYLFFLVPRSEIEAWLLDQPSDGVMLTDGEGDLLASTLPGAGDAVSRERAFLTAAPQEPVNTSYEASFLGKTYQVQRVGAGTEFVVYTLYNITALRAFTRWMAAALCAATVLFLGVLLFYANKTRRSTRLFWGNLRMLAGQCREENLAYRIEGGEFDEFHEIYKLLNGMVAQMQGLLEKNAEMAERRRQMEVSHLEGQFNPHFVFNLLANLRYMILADPKTASEMVSGLSRLMRYSINYGRNDVPLRIDTEHLGDYLMLQKSRYGDRFTYEIGIDPELLDQTIPKLLIQPLVENCIKHNIENTDTLRVEVTGRREGGDMVLSVADNGRGIPPQDLFDLRAMLAEGTDKGNHVGLYNVHRTIQLKYGDQYGLSIQSIYNRGTDIIVRMPYKGEEEDV